MQHLLSIYSVSLTLWLYICCCMNCKFNPQGKNVITKVSGKLCLIEQSSTSFLFYGNPSISPAAVAWPNEHFKDFAYFFIRKTCGIHCPASRSLDLLPSDRAPQFITNSSKLETKRQLSVWSDLECWWHFSASWCA